MESCPWAARLRNIASRLRSISFWWLLLVWVDEMLVSDNFSEFLNFGRNSIISPRHVIVVYVVSHFSRTNNK